MITLFSLSPSVFLKKTKNPCFSLFFSSLVSRPRRPLNGYLRNRPGLVASSHCHLAIIHTHVTTVTHCSCMLVYLIVSENKLSLICLTFTGTLNQFHFTLLFTFTSFRTISYFSSSSRCFLWSIYLHAWRQWCSPRDLQSRLEAPYWGTLFKSLEVWKYRFGSPSEVKSGRDLN